jgi:two-component system, LytTR family, response regulator
MPEAPDTLRVVIVDDEELARRGLRRDLAAAPGIDVVAECADGFEAVRVVSETRPDIVLLDIQMPRLDGFEVLELIDPTAAVIFVTAHDEHAVRAFEVNAVDYLLKPVDPDRLLKAVTRARERLARREPMPVAALTAAARPAGTLLSRILVRDGPRVHVLPVESVDYVEAQDDYVAIHAGGKSHLKQQPIAQLETALDPGRFVRIHRSYILNLDRLARIELYAKDSRVAILRDGSRLPLSRSGHARLRGLLHE